MRRRSCRDANYLGESVPWPDSSTDDPAEDDPEVEDAWISAGKVKRYHLKQIYAPDMSLVLPTVLVTADLLPLLLV